MAGELIQYAWFVYWDDVGTPWAVYMRKRNGVIGNFEPLTFEQASNLKNTMSVWGWQRLSMRHITIKTQDGKYLKCPVQKPTSSNFHRVLESITFPQWDSGIDDGAPPGPTITGTIVGRVGENFRGMPYRPIPTGNPV